MEKRNGRRISNKCRRGEMRRKISVEKCRHLRQLDICGRKAAFNLGCEVVDWTSAASQPTGWRQSRVAGSCEYGTGVSGSI